MPLSKKTRGGMTNRAKFNIILGIVLTFFLVCFIYCACLQKWLLALSFMFAGYFLFFLVIYLRRKNTRGLRGNVSKYKH